jgi:hypothetical protein
MWKSPPVGGPRVGDEPIPLVGQLTPSGSCHIHANVATVGVNQPQTRSDYSQKELTNE